MKVFVYYNLHRHCWSVRCQQPGHPEYGRVIAHMDTVHLRGCTFRVGKAGRERVREEGRKNVHAGVVGCLAFGDIKRISTREITYNPYKYDTFVFKNTEKPVHEAEAVVMHNKKVYQASAQKG